MIFVSPCLSMAFPFCLLLVPLIQLPPRFPCFFLTPSSLFIPLQKYSAAIYSFADRERASIFPFALRLYSHPRYRGSCGSFFSSPTNSLSLSLSYRLTFLFYSVRFPFNSSRHFSLARLFLNFSFAQSYRTAERIIVIRSRYQGASEWAWWLYFTRERERESFARRLPLCKRYRGNKAWDNSLRREFTGQVVWYSNEKVEVILIKTKQIDQCVYFSRLILKFAYLSNFQWSIWMIASNI